jgi:hypothetical protein
MDRTLGIFSIIMLILIIITAGMVVTAVSTPRNDGGVTGALKVAKAFVANDPTYKFDGMADTMSIRVTGTFPDPGKYEVTADFTSRQSGYGDRAGMMLAQMLTPHKCVLTVTNGQVTSAVMDGSYDMMAGKALPSP